MAMNAGIALLASLVLAACATAPGIVCRPGEKSAVADTLYFGTARAEGAVSAVEWNEFLAQTVTPRFPDGLTAWPAAGQWQSAGGTTREASYVLSLVHADDPASESAIREIMRAYKTQYHQEAVLRSRAPTCMSL
jgi:hypothetical protein